jgi:hypothetical protein
MAPSAQLRTGKRFEYSAASPSRARTTMASSRYAWATRIGDAMTPARRSTGSYSTSSARPGSLSLRSGFW